MAIRQRAVENLDEHPVGGVVAGDGQPPWGGRRFKKLGQFAQVQAGWTIHGLSDGKWSLADALIRLQRAVGKCHLTCATWTAAGADLTQVSAMLARGDWDSVRFLLDYSFVTRKQESAQELRQLFGVDCIRLWRGHCKFSILHGGAFDILYLTSANLNKNPRVENFTVYCGGELPGEYLSLVNDIYAAQTGEEVMRNPAKSLQSTLSLLR